MANNPPKDNNSGNKHTNSDTGDKLDKLLDFWFRKYVDLAHQEDFADSINYAKQALLKLINEEKVKELLNLPFGDGRWTYEEIEEHWKARVERLKGKKS